MIAAKIPHSPTTMIAPTSVGNLSKPIKYNSVSSGFLPTTIVSQIIHTINNIPDNIAPANATPIPD